MPNNIYKDSIQRIELSIPDGTQSSVNFICANEPDAQAGFGMIRRILFPSNWVTADVTFRIFENSSFSGNGSLHYSVDQNGDVGIVTLSAVPATTLGFDYTSVDVIPADFDSISYMRIESSVAQNLGAQNIIIALQPLYQVPAG